METVNLRNELTTLQKTIADGALQFDVKGISTKIAARQLIGTYVAVYTVFSCSVEFKYYFNCRQIITDSLSTTLSAV